MDKRVWLVLVAVSLLCLTGLLTGCSDDDSDNSGTETPLGAMRSYQTGDTWTYNVSGTYVPNSGPSQAINTATATLVYDQQVVPAAKQTAVETLTLSVPITHGTYEENAVYTIGFNQAGNGTMSLVGLNTANVVSVIDEFDSAIAGPPGDNLAGTNSWSGSANCPTFGAFSISTTKDATTSVSTPAGDFQSYEASGTKSLGGFASSFTAWVNPQLGSFARMETSYEDTLGTTNLTYVLASTTVDLED